MKNGRTAIRHGILLATALILIGCASAPKDQQPMDPAEVERIAKRDALIAEQLPVVEKEIHARIAAAAAAMKSNAATTEQRDYVIAWESGTQLRFNTIFTQEDSAWELGQAWVLAHRIRDHIAKVGPKKLNDQATPGIEAMDSIILLLEDKIDDWTPADKFETYRDQVEELSKDNPLDENLKGRPTIEVVEEAVKKNKFSGFNGVGASVAALKGVAGGVGALGGALTGTVGGAVGGVTEGPLAPLKDLPKETRIQTELLYATVEKSDMATSAFQNVDRFASTGESFAETGARFAGVAETLPEDLRTNIIQALEESKKSQEELRLTMQEATRLMEGTQSTLSEGESLAQAVKGVMVEATALTDSVNKVQEAAKPAPGTPPPTPAPPSRPFDITEYQAAVESLNVTVKELRGTVEEVHDMVADGSIDKTAQAAGNEASRLVESAVGDTKGLVKFILIGVGILLVFYFLLLVGYQFIKRAIWAKKNTV